MSELGGAGYWMNETTGALRPAVLGFLAGGRLTGEEIALLREYFRQWINGEGTSMLSSGRFETPEIATLRLAVDGLETRRALAAWRELAVRAGVDPL